MDQPSESPLTPLGLQLQDASDLHSKNLDYPITDVCGWTFLLWLMGPFCISNFMLANLIAFEDYSGGALAFAVQCCRAISMGVIPLQLVVLSYYAVFSNEAWWFRLALFAGLFALCSAVGLLGLYILALMKQWPIDEWEIESALQTVCLLPLLAFSAQLPFWPLRIFFGWQFVPTSRQGSEATAQPERQSHFSILQLMVATAIVAVVLGILRMAPVELTSESDFWTGCAVFASLAIGCSLLGGIPLMLCFTGLKSWLLAYGLTVGLPLVIGWSVTGYLAWNLNPSAQSAAVFAASMITFFSLTFVLGIAVSLLLLRMHSWTIGRPTRSVESRSGSNG
jgi:uncharacterized membrane protein YqjE